MPPTTSATSFLRNAIAASRPRRTSRIETVEFSARSPSTYAANASSRIGTTTDAKASPRRTEENSSEARSAPTGPGPTDSQSMSVVAPPERNTLAPTVVMAQRSRQRFQHRAYLRLREDKPFRGGQPIN